ncbi:Uncharacterised protein [Bordetella pertussis]|nr:Uncharacterised protein [Bordetella pertussis]
MEQFHAVARFELAQLARYRGLADPQLGGRLGDGAAARYGVERFEFGDQHRKSRARRAR